jgi:16S rRNA (uracil1498-N3)-methyltransferase
MRINRIYLDKTLQTGQTLDLPLEISRRLQQVLRLKTGASLQVFDNQGKEYTATLTSLPKNLCVIEIGLSIAKETESPLVIHLLPGFSRSEKMDFIIQKATELGVREITPLFTEFAKVKLSGARLQSRITHLQTVALHATEQCGRTRIPQIHPPLPLKKWLMLGKKAYEPHTLPLMLHPNSPGLKPLETQPKKIIVLVGPEGGFSPAETHLAKTEGFTLVGLGPRILRTETAPLAILSLLQFLWGDLGLNNTPKWNDT